jgi:hypothetical protein
MLAQICCNTYMPSRRCTVKLRESTQAPQTLPMSQPRVCRHGRMISDRVTEEEHNGGKVRCVECGTVISNPHL